MKKKQKIEKGSSLGFSFCLNINGKEMMFISFSSFSALSYLELKIVAKKKNALYFHMFCAFVSLFSTRCVSNISHTGKYCHLFRVGI